MPYSLKIGARIAEHPLGLRVDHLDEAGRSDHHNRVWRDSTTRRKRSSSRLRAEMSTIAESTMVPSSVSNRVEPDLDGKLTAVLP